MKDIKKMEEKIGKTLRDIGLSKSEAIIYLDLVKNFDSTALEVSKRTKLHRANIYDSLRRLNQRGFVAEVITNERKYFEALAPEKIKTYLKQKEEEVEKAIENLKKYPQKNRNGHLNGDKKVSIVEGKLAIRNLIEDSLKSSEPVYLFGAHPESHREIGADFIEEYHRRRVALGIPLKIIFSENVPERIEKLNTLPLTEARHLNHGRNALLATIISGENVNIICLKNLTTIIIKNRDIAEAYKDHFASAWKHASV